MYIQEYSATVSLTAINVKTGGNTGVQTPPHADKHGPHVRQHGPHVIKGMNRPPQHGPHKVNVSRRPPCMHAPQVESKTNTPDKAGAPSYRGPGQFAGHLDRALEAHSPKKTHVPQLVEVADTGSKTNSLLVDLRNAIAKFKGHLENYLQNSKEKINQSSFQSITRNVTSPSLKVSLRSFYSIGCHRPAWSMAAGQQGITTGGQQTNRVMYRAFYQSASLVSLSGAGPLAAALGQEDGSGDQYAIFIIDPEKYLEKLEALLKELDEKLGHTAAETAPKEGTSPGAIGFFEEIVQSAVKAFSGGGGIV